MVQQSAENERGDSGVARVVIALLLMQDPSVMSAALCALLEVAGRDPKPYKNLIPSFVSILKQVCNRDGTSCLYAVAWPATSKIE